MFKKNILVGVLGLISTQNWDTKLNKDFFMGFMAKSNKYKGDITFSFFNKINKKIKPNLLAVSGFNSKIELIYKRIGYVCDFTHFYILNPKLKSKVSSKLISKKNDLPEQENLILKISNIITVLPSNKQHPKKSLMYFKNKYLKNPFYKYFVLNFYKKNELVFFFICKKVKINTLGTDIYRIVDFYGEIKQNYNIYNSILNLLINNNIEYIDCRCVEYNLKIMQNLGFNKKKGPQIIPDYFELV